jgi:DNA polymerase-3 subunit gamma/tau
MSYLVIARKYRPQTFSDVIGQEHITQTLQNAIRLDKISHAYLFTGPRGVGKTTSARIFAKAVNCKNRKTEDPCNECDTCKEITKSESVDIIEIDAASNRGIDEIRQLRENIKFAPANATYKVYIIDEVHMLTKEAFNAILKTLEEPPPHVIFIMATTEPEKVLETISSRCQQFNFKLLTENVIFENLKSIAEKEKIKYEEEGLLQIASAAAGGIRDAQSIMDQAISFSGGKIAAKDINELLGIIPQDYMFTYTDHVKNSDIKGALELTEKLLREGHNLNSLFNEILKHFRNLMFAKVFGEATGFMGFNKEYSEKLAKCSESFSKEQLVWITEFLSKNTGRIRFSENQHIVMDTIIFRLCQKYVGFDDVISMVEKGGATIIKEEVSSAPAPVVNVEESKSAKPTVKKEKPAKSSQKPTGVTPKKGGKWDQILDLIKKESQPLYHSLKESTASLKGKTIVIPYSSKLDLTERYRAILGEKIKEVMGAGDYPESQQTKKVEKKKEEEKIEEPKKQKVNPAQIEEDEPVVGEIMGLFGGRIEKE